MRQALMHQSHDANLMPHAGLVLAQGLEAFSNVDQDAKRRLVDAVAAIDLRVGHVYEGFYKRWEEGLAALKDGESPTEMRNALAESRLVVGLGGKGLLEAGLTLHHSLGTPYLPGSALKGLASSYAAQRLAGPWAKGGEAHQALFGDTESSGLVVFHDALLQPNPQRRKPLLPDVLTVHHPDYYQGGGQEPPADWDSPNPVPFLTVAPRTTFRFALTGPDAWRKAAWEILGLSLRDFGVGGKTSAGYGRLKLEGTMGGKAKAGEAPKVEDGPLVAKLKGWGNDVAKLLYKPLGKEFTSAWMASQDAADKKASAALLFAALDASPNAKAFHKDLERNAWYKDMATLVRT